MIRGLRKCEDCRHYVGPYLFCYRAGECWDKNCWEPKYRQMIENADRKARCNSNLNIFLKRRKSK